ncbi:TonB-dependent receptor plug domain-containing protein [Paraferrimonas haliotis]|uniref:TonB-dependent receptor plug domain-containing protein n=1 Tax=Paraferrimonas haliotis TaxID=2013866 RepID=UPI000BA940AC|nr:TonB-dependent receptor [Paraferrimonas haliotis]
MHSNSILAKSVRTALAFGAVTTAFAAPTVFAADEDGAEVERIEVTGSRITRTDLEGASPVTVITSENMKMEGNFTVADALRNSNLNSFGSFSERSGSSAQSQATINLRGAGSSRTLVLLDGKRFPGSPTLGGASANLNAIPMSAVERIEILTDGASSIYGSDAIAGVVNIIMKKKFEGIEFSVGGGSRERDDGLNSKEFSVTTGYSTDKGNITFSWEHQDRDGISDADRDYTSASTITADTQAYTETSGWSIYGATVAAPDFSEAQASLLCDDLIAEYGNNTFAKVKADDDWGPGSTYCMYAYANVSYNKASIDRNTVYVNADYMLTDDIEWFGRTMFTVNRSFGRYAPPAAPWRNMAADNPHNPYGEETTGYFRWVGIGTRDGFSDDYNQDYLTGLRGELDLGVNMNWELYYHYNKADNKNVGRSYLSYGGLAHNQANGIDLGSDEGIANLKHTTLQHDTSTFHQYNGSVSFDLFDLPAGAIAHAFGGEYFTQDFASQYDGQSEAGLVGGSAGNSAGGDRSVTAFFYEAAIPVLENLEVNVAARYDNYSDFGGQTSPKVSARWEIIDGLVLRGSYSEAFRAPSLDQLYAATSFSAESAKDYVQCDAQGISEADCPSRQFDTYYSSNDNLGPETSKYANVGVAWDLHESMAVKVDFFDLKVDDVIQTRTVQSLINAEREGLISSGPTIPPGETFYLQRISGRLNQAGTGYDNGSGFNIQGIDFTFNGNLETGIGDFGVNWLHSYQLKYEVEDAAGGELINTAGWNGQPKHKSNATFSWDMSNHNLAYNANYTGETYEDQDTGKLDSWLIHNLTYTFSTESYGQVRLAVLNLTDEDPVLSSLGTYDNADLYNNYGREYRATYTIRF